jgi:hypothetical protein
LKVSEQWWQLDGHGEVAALCTGDSLKGSVQCGSLMGSVQWRHLVWRRDVAVACSGGSLKGSVKWRQRVVAAFLKGNVQ